MRLNLTARLNRRKTNRVPTLTTNLHQRRKQRRTTRRTRIPQVMNQHTHHSRNRNPHKRLAGTNPHHSETRNKRQQKRRHITQKTQTALHPVSRLLKQRRHRQMKTHTNEQRCTQHVNADAHALNSHRTNSLAHRQPHQAANDQRAHNRMPQSTVRVREIVRPAIILRRRHALNQRRRLAKQERQHFTHGAKVANRTRARVIQVWHHAPPGHRRNKTQHQHQRRRIPQVSHHARKQPDSNTGNRNRTQRVRHTHKTQTVHAETLPRLTDSQQMHNKPSSHFRQTPRHNARGEETTR